HRIGGRQPRHLEILCGVGDFRAVWVGLGVYARGHAGRDVDVTGRLDVGRKGVARVDAAVLVADGEADIGDRAAPEIDRAAVADGGRQRGDVASPDILAWVAVH